MGQAIDQQLVRLQDVSATRTFRRYLADLRRFVAGAEAFGRGDQKEFHDQHEIEVAAIRLGGVEYYLAMKPQEAEDVRQEVATQMGVKIDPDVLEQGIMIPPIRR